MSESRTVVARLSPPGKSAVACIGVAGPRAWEIIRQRFRRPDGGALPEQSVATQAFIGSLGDAVAGDQVVVFVRRGPPDWLVEIDCHGGAHVVRMLEDVLAAAGAAIISASDWSAAIDGMEAAAMLDVLTRCSTARTAGIALDQLNGAFDRAMAELGGLAPAPSPHGSPAGEGLGEWGQRASRGLNPIASETPPLRERSPLTPAPVPPEYRRERRVRLSAMVSLGEHLARPWRVVIAGAPNVGKSSLVNALAGFTRSVVNPTPGTTRDVVSTAIALDGWPIELLDTAGLRATDDHLEAAGIARADAARGSADLVIWVLDASTPPEEPVAADLVVVNKIDCPAVWDLPPDSLRVSAKTGAGLDRMIGAIVAHLVPVIPDPGEAVPITASQRERVRAINT